MSQIIHHEGVVKHVEGNSVCVTILQASACSGCAAKALCSSAESKEKEVEVFTSQAATFSPGERVRVEGRLSDGRWAAFYAYGLPLFLLLPVLWLSVQLSGSERLGACWALGTTVIYYGIMYLMRDRIARKFSFNVCHLDA